MNYLIGYLIFGIICGEALLFYDRKNKIKTTGYDYIVAVFIVPILFIPMVLLKLVLTIRNR